jgi:hypothetical protein
MVAPCPNSPPKDRYYKDPTRELETIRPRWRDESNGREDDGKLTLPDTSDKLTFSSITSRRYGLRHDSGRTELIVGNGKTYVGSIEAAGNDGEVQESTPRDGFQ